MTISHIHNISIASQEMAFPFQVHQELLTSLSHGVFLTDILNFGSAPPLLQPLPATSPLLIFYRFQLFQKAPSPLFHCPQLCKSSSSHFSSKLGCSILSAHALIFPGVAQWRFVKFFPFFIFFFPPSFPTPGLLHLCHLLDVPWIFLTPEHVLSNVQISLANAPASWLLISGEGQGFRARVTASDVLPLFTARTPGKGVALLLSELPISAKNSYGTWQKNSPPRGKWLSLS